MTPSELREAFAVLRTHWQASGQDWRDETRTRFDHEFWMPLDVRTQAYMADYDRAAQIASEIERFAASVKPIRGL